MVEGKQQEKTKQTKRNEEKDNESPNTLSQM